MGGSVGGSLTPYHAAGEVLEGTRSHFMLWEPVVEDTRLTPSQCWRILDLIFLPHNDVRGSIGDIRPPCLIRTAVGALLKDVSPPPPPSAVGGTLLANTKLHASHRWRIAYVTSLTPVVEGNCSKLPQLLPRVE